MNAPRPSDGLLDGIRVVDCTVARAGPTCVRQLADLGADVVRIVQPGRLDLPGSDAWNLHRNKRSILLDLKRDAGREVLLRLTRRADVFVENFRAGVKHRLKIDHETLRAENPRLVYASISGYGQSGPYAERPAVDPIIQGLAGLMSVTGEPGSGPWRTGIALSDSAAGTFLAQGVLAALYARERTGQGQWVKTSLLEALLNFMDFQAARWLNDGQVPKQEGNDHPTLFPMGTFRARDGWINVAPALHFERFAEALDRERWLEDERFESFQARNTNREALRAEIEAALAARDREEWVQLLNDAGVPAGPVLDIQQVFEDPQVQHLDIAARLEHEKDGEHVVLRSPLSFSAAEPVLRSAAPTPGADTEAVLEELGYSEEEIGALREQGVAGRSE